MTLILILNKILSAAYIAEIKTKIKIEALSNPRLCKRNKKSLKKKWKLYEVYKQKN